MRRLCGDREQLSVLLGATVAALILNMLSEFCRMPSWLSVPAFGRQV